MSGGYEFKLIGLQGEETTVQQSEGPYSCTYCGMKFTNQEACDNHQCACKRKVEAEEMNMIRSRRNAEPFFELGSHGNRTVGHGVPSIIQEMEPPNDYTQPFLSQLERYLEHCEDLANVEYKCLLELLESEGENEFDPEPDPDPDPEHLDLTLRL